ncbi:MAG: glycosyltransferase, partial [Candidatus Omnitrophica bacterium]|nr:glycosyltransferase [Candidatus Omnitrophota bacterium]
MSLSWILGGLVFYYRRERKEIECPPLKSYPLFSVIVPAHNEEAGIADTVRNLEKIEYPNFEVIVVNDGSTDKTSQ